MAEGRVEDIYTRIKRMAVTFEIRPGERINEVALSRALEVSRTPLREALNRLVAEQLVEFRPGTGFFCRALDPQSIYDLYELRQVLETAAVRLACARASDDGLAALRADLESTGLETTGRTVAELTERDEAFHTGIAALTGNTALLADLTSVNARIRFIRWIDMARRTPTTKGEHLKIMEALEARDATRAVEVMTAHISRRMDQVVDAVKEGYSSIYMTGPDELPGRRIEDT